MAIAHGFRFAAADLDLNRAAETRTVMHDSHLNSPDVSALLDHDQQILAGDHHRPVARLVMLRDQLLDIGVQQLLLRSI